MKTWMLTLAIALLTTTAAQAKQGVPESFTLGRELCLATARTQLLDNCDFQAELKTRSASVYGMALDICGTYGESNPARETLCFTKAAAVLKEDDVSSEVLKCRELSTASEKSTCLKKVFTAKNSQKTKLAEN